MSKALRLNFQRIGMPTSALNINFYILKLLVYNSVSDTWRILLLWLVDLLTLLFPGKLLKFLGLKNRLVNGLTVRIGNYLVRLYDFRSLVILHPSYEKEELEVLLRLVRDVGEKPILIDVGGHLGKYVFMLNNVYSRAYVLEPNPVVRNYLLWNITVNFMEERVSVLPFAAYDRDGPVRFLVPVDRSDCGRVVEPGSSAGASGIVVWVEARRLDSLFSFCNTFLVVKIDVEGAEEEVLRGGARLFTCNRVVLLVEVRPQTLQRVVRLLAWYGYRVMWYRVYRAVDGTTVVRMVWTNLPDAP